MDIDEAVLARIVALIPKVKKIKANKDKAKVKDLTKMSKAELVALVKELTA